MSCIFVFAGVHHLGDRSLLSFVSAYHLSAAVHHNIRACVSLLQRPWVLKEHRVHLHVHSIFVCSEGVSSLVDDFYGSSLCEVRGGLRALVSLQVTCSVVDTFDLALVVLI